MKKYLSLAIISTFITTACSSNEQKNDVLEGKVKRESIAITPKVPGRIAKLFVREAEVVKEGDTLAILNVPEVEAKITQAEGAVLAAKAQYQMAVNGATSEQRKQVDAMYNAAKEQFAFAEKSLNRLKEMYQDSLIAAQQYDEVMAKYQGAQAQLQAALAKKQEVYSGTRSEQVEMALGQLKRAEGALQEAKTAFAERYILAPKDMSIETITLREGELALPGYNLVIGYEPATTYFRFTIPESAVKEFKRGQKFSVRLPFEDAETEGVLVSMNQLSSYANKSSAYPNYQLGEALYELKVEPTNQKAAAEFLVQSTALLIKK